MTTITTIYKPSQTLTLRSFQTLINNPTILFTPPSQPKSATTTRELHTPCLNYVLAKGFSTVSSSDKVTLSDTVEWEEMEVVADVRSSLVGENLVDLKSLVEKNKANCIKPPSLANNVVFRFGSTKPQTIGLDASISGSDNSYMVVFNYGSVILLNVGEPEVHERLKMVEAHALGSTGEISKYFGTVTASSDLLLPQNTPLMLGVLSSRQDYCSIGLDIGFFGEEVLMSIFRM
ncbi:hypothetical protein Tco_0494037 [Tanacetum coccineum]